MSNEPSCTRRTVLQISMSFLVAGSTASAASARGYDLSKASVAYQKTPKGNAYCNICKFYIPAKKGVETGECWLTEGAIIPKGWCTLWEPKP